MHFRALQFSLAVLELVIPHQSSVSVALSPALDSSYGPLGRWQVLLRSVLGTRPLWALEVTDLIWRVRGAPGPNRYSPGLLPARQTQKRGTAFH